MRRMVLSAMVLALAGTASAQPPAPPLTTPPPPPKISITIYSANLALVQETRTLDLTPGRQRLEFKDVSAMIRPETVSLSGPGLAVVEQNFDYDLLSPAKMMEKAVGREVIIVRTNPGNGAEVRETATVLSVNDGVVLKIGERIEILRDDGVPTRVIFDKVPENLRARPTLSVTVAADKAGRGEATLTYLTSGLGWKADYVALFDEKAKTLDLQGWITLTNQSGTTYADADALLVAGTVGGAGPGYRPQGGIAGARQAGTEGFSDGADYLMYPLPQRTTIANNQSKQVGFLTANRVAAAKVYRYRSYGFSSAERPTNASVSLQFANSQSTGLGQALPGGMLRIYIRDQAGDPKFSGEAPIGHTPQGTQLDLRMGDAFDVTVQPTLVSSERQNARRTRYVMSYSVKNARPDPVTVQVIQGGFRSGAKIVKESLASKRVDAGTLQWEVPVPGNGETILTFTLDDQD